MENDRTDLCRRYIKILAVVACYWVASIATVFVNKALLSGQQIPLEAPLFISWFQCVVSFLICAALSATGGIYKIFTFPKGSPWQINMLKKLFPLSVIFTLMIANSNLSLQHVSLSFYYIARSLTTVFNVIFCWLILRQVTSGRCVACCAAIIFGFCLGVDQENLLGSFSLSGTIYGVVGSLVLALFSIYTKKILPFVDQGAWLMTYSINAYSVVLFLPLIALNGEIQVLRSYPRFNSTYFWIQMSIGSVCGLAVGHLTSLQIQVTSPLTHNISGTAKACTQTVLATQWHREPKSALWWLSNAIVLGSSALYAWFKQLEMDTQLRTPPHQGRENQAADSVTEEPQKEKNTVEKYSVTQDDGYPAGSPVRTVC